MANKWMRKLGMGMTVIMTVSQLNVGMVMAAPEDDNYNDEIEQIDYSQETAEEEDTVIEAEDEAPVPCDQYAYTPETEDDIIVYAGETSGKCGDNLTWRLDTTGVLWISGTGDMYDYTSSNTLFYNNESIKKIVIKDGVTSIGFQAFAGCSNLKSVELGKNIERIGQHAFCDCIGITDITLPESVTKIDRYAFLGCSKLKHITMSENISSIGDGAFKDCTSLLDIALPENITSINELTFCNCKSLKELVIPEKVEKIGVAAFFSCESLESIVVPEKVTEINYNAFKECKNLKSCQLPGGLTKIDEAIFSGCINLSEITIPCNVTSIGVKAFYQCESLKKLSIPESVTNIGKCTFQNSAIEEITVPENITVIKEGTFSGCSKLKKIFLPNSLMEINAKIIDGCSALSYIGYNGTREEWNNIEIDEDNEFLSGMDVHCTDDPVITLVQTITLDSTELDLKEGESKTLVATIAPENVSDNSIKWSSNNTSVVTVDESGKITAVKAGTAKITATATNGTDDTSDDKTASCTVTVVSADTPIVDITGVTLNKTSVSIDEGKTATLIATIAPDNATDTTVTWGSSNTAVATISKNGVITAKKAGTAIITVTATNGTKDTSDDKSATCTVTVTGPETNVSDVVLNCYYFTLLEGESAVLTANVYPESATNKSLMWSVGDSKIVSFDSYTGTVTGLKEGTTTITVTATNGTTDTSDDRTAECQIEVLSDQPAISVTDISLNKSTVELEVDGKTRLIITIEPSDASDKTVVWSTDNADVATVNESGVVTAVSAGTARITATATNGTEMTADDVSAFCRITVAEKETWPKEVTGNTFSKENASKGVPVMDGYHLLTLALDANGDFSGAKITGSNGDIDETIDSYIANIVIKSDAQGNPVEFYSLVFRHGVWDTTYDSGKDGAYVYGGIEYFVAGGVVNQNANGLIYTGDKTGWRFLAAGHVVTDNEGLVMYNGEWFWIDNAGKCDDTYAAIVKWNGADFLVHGGRLRTDYTGFTYDPQNTSVWYHITNGQVWGDGEITDISIEGGTISRIVQSGKVVGIPTPTPTPTPVPTNVPTVIPMPTPTPAPTPVGSIYKITNLKPENQEIQINPGDSIIIEKGYIDGTLIKDNRIICTLETDGDGGGEGITISSDYLRESGKYIFNFWLYEAEEKSNGFVNTRGSNGNWGNQFVASDTIRGSYLGSGCLYITVKGSEEKETISTEFIKDLDGGYTLKCPSVIEDYFVDTYKGSISIVDAMVFLNENYKDQISIKYLVNDVEGTSASFEICFYDIQGFNLGSSSPIQVFPRDINTEKSENTYIPSGTALITIEP